MTQTESKLAYFLEFRALRTLIDYKGATRHQEKVRSFKVPKL